jgi:PTH1 family peptidyl-tRNA hydrolase
MRLLVGLGNPGAEYAGNRHNIGFMAVDAIAARHGLGPFRSKFQGALASGTVAGEKVLVLKPQTFMNLSGQAVGQAARFHKLEPADVVVFHDELDLAPGKMKIKTGGGAAGHNGLRSIDAHLGNAYRRVRLGIGHPGDKARVHGYVLSDFAKADRDWLGPLLDALADHAPLLLQDRESDYMSKVAQATRPPQPKPNKPKAEKIESPAPAPAKDTAAAPPAPQTSPAAPKTALGEALRRALGRG